MFRWQTITGVALGLSFGFTILALTSSPPRRPAPSGRILSECDGHLRELIMQYEPSAKEIAATTYREFLQALDADVTVHALCPTQAAFDDLIAQVGATRCKLLPVIANHPMTTWSRDRWVSLQGSKPDGPTIIYSPQSEAGNEVWPSRAGDERVGVDVARALAPRALARRSGLYFDGGDILSDGRNVFVMPRLLSRNIQHTVTNRQQLVEILGTELNRHVVLLDEAPDHHAGMFMASIGNNTMLVADPKLGRELLSASGQNSAAFATVVHELPGGPDFKPETQRLFDVVADQCAALGYRVVRIPVIPAQDGRTFLTYVNALIDEQAVRRVVYLPRYDGCEIMNTAARTIWETEGYEVRTVNCTATYRHFGCLHCLVNVFSRSPVSLQTKSRSLEGARGHTPPRA